MNTSTDFPISEADLVHSLNVARSIVRQKRADLTEGVDWSRVKNRGAQEVAWSQKGAARLRSLLLGENAASEAPTHGTGHSSEKPGGEILEVAARIHPAQPWALPCVGPGGGKDRAHWVFVRVANGDNFKPGMKIRAERGNYGAWRYLGHPDDPVTARARYPRGVGIW